MLSKEHFYSLFCLRFSFISHVSHDLSVSDFHINYPNGRVRVVKFITAYTLLLRHFICVRYTRSVLPRNLFRTHLQPLVFSQSKISNNIFDAHTKQQVHFKFYKAILEKFRRRDVRAKCCKQNGLLLVALKLSLSLLSAFACAVFLEISGHGLVACQIRRHIFFHECFFLVFPHLQISLNNEFSFRGP
jgi:hypothetical protein